MSSDVVSKRIFVGGLGVAVTETDLTDKFSRFGNVSGLNLKQRKGEDGAVEKSFAHLNIECTEADLKKCFATFQNAKWKGSTLKLQYAKESFLTKLDKERVDTQREVVEQAVKQREEAARLELKRKPVEKIFSGPAVPGTQVPGKQDWIVGKYGRVLPVMKLKKSSRTAKVLRHDPSKLCHTAKVFKEKDAEITSSCDALSWEMETDETEIVKRIKGKFKTVPKKKKQPLSVTESVGDKQFVLENITSSRHYLELKKTLPADDDLEVVSVNQKHKTPSFPRNKSSNIFDSDSETEPSENLNSKTKSGKRNSSLDSRLQLLAGQKPKVSNKFDSDSGSEGDDLSQSKNQIDLNKRNSSLDKRLQVLAQQESEPSPKQESNKFGSNSETKVNPLPLSKKSKSTKRDFGLDNRLLLLAGKGDVDNSPADNKKKVLEISKENIDSAKKRKKKDLNMNSAKTSRNSVNIPEDSFNSEINNNSVDMESCKNKSDDDSKSLKQSVKNSRDKQTERKPFVTVPKFGGLSMLSSDDENDKSIDVSKQTKIKKEPKPTEDIDKSKSKKRKLSPEPSPVNNTDNSPDNTFDSEQGYDSACSADTDEILQKHKSKKSQSTDTSEPRGQAYLKSLASQRCSDLDQKLLLLAGSTEDCKVGQVAVNSGYGSDDGELDSNDFELVAKRLAQKEADKKVKNQSKKMPTNVKPVSKTPKVEPTVEIIKTEPSPKSDKTPDIAAIVKDKKGDSKNKQLSVNEKRLQAVKEKMKLKQQQQNIMKQAFDNIDSKKNNKRKVFNSDDDDDDDEEDKEVDKSVKTDSSKKAKITELVEEEKKKQSLKLFDESAEESDEDSDYGEMFKSRPHLEGRKGERLMKLERKIGDSRFKLDAKFADSDSGEESEEDAAAEPSELAAERDASLKVLEKVVGKSTLDIFTRKIKKNTKTIIDMNTVRFDPTKMSPVQPAKTKTHPKKLSIETKDPETDIPETSEVEKLEKTPEVEKKEDAKSNVVVASSLVDLFKKKDETQEPGGFSLLSQFDSPLSPDNKTDLSNFFPKQTTNTAVNIEDDEDSDDNDSNEDNDDETSEDDEHEDDFEDDEHEDDFEDDENESDAEEADKILDKKDKKLSVKKSAPFLMDSDDDNNDDVEDKSGDDLSEGSEAEIEEEKTTEDKNDKQRFSKELWDAGRVDVRYTKDQWLARWEEIRPVLVKLYKRKHKDAVKKRRIQSEQKRRKEFSKGSKRNSWFRKKS